MKCKALFVTTQELLDKFIALNCDDENELDGIKPVVINLKKI
jgi:hypothetical protein